MTCAHVNSTEINSQLKGGPAVGRQARQAVQGGKGQGCRTKSYVSLLSARAPVSYQFRMREPGTSLSLEVFHHNGGVGGGDAYNCWPLALALPSLPACPCQRRRF